ncbi:recombinase family protein [Ruegeria pomeroyi]|uniref:Recombinase family protein n=1 Tax=Ruegeria pomeroyi TaxID=89184 RepID=A0A9Q3WP33_9RHOB|nr:recombinase family protein [Ruegeria pomeroyi]MCE8539721.1 recombinase family protein [Ruegeria pomeroyi]
MTQTVLYARVSTTEQTAAHQCKQAEDSGFVVDRVIADEGVSGVSVPFGERPEAKRLFDILRAGDVLVVRWVDRLGRDYDDVTATIRRLMSQGVIIRTVINNFTFDGATDDPVQKAVRDALIAFMAATSQAQAEATKAAQKAGIAHAKASADAHEKYRGKKPSYTRAQLDAVKAMLVTGSETVSGIARAVGLSRQAVLRIRDTPEVAEAALSRWGM